MGNEKVELVTKVKPEKKQSLVEKYDISLEKLSFEYITESRNVREIERMILILRSGEEGFFPELLKHAEDRLRSLKPESQVLRVAQPILTPQMLDKEQRESLEKAMSQWMRQMHLREKDLEDGKALDLTDTIPQPEIRKITDRSKKSRSGEQSKNSQRIKSCDYSAWDKYDVDTEVNRIDLRSEQEVVRAKQVQRKMREKKLAEKEAINKLALTGTEITVLAEKEKEKGNEAFRVGDYEEALQQYSLSLEINATINGYNNRAITYIKLRKYQEAIDDCDRVLSLDCTNVKALLRRASALESLGRKEEALREFSAALKIEPNNRTAMMGVRKLSVYEGRKKVRMTIEEFNENEEGIDEKKVEDTEPSTASASSERIIEEVETSPEEKFVESKISKCEGKGVKFPEESRPMKKSNEVCFCDRAPGSSTYPKPLPHRRGEYCVPVARNEINKHQSIFTFSTSCSNYPQPSGVVIEEIPSEPCGQITKKITKNGEKKMEEDSSRTPDNFRFNVDTPYEFLCTWESLKNDSDLKLRAELLKAIGSENLESLIGSRLDGEMFSTILRCLERHFCQEENLEFVDKFLKALTDLKRFSIIKLFMSSHDKQAVKTITDFLEEHQVATTSHLRAQYITF
ncbi:sperm-associated antigen 1 [Fopius arisanus]|uniref:Sperm-associated antigen 1 n=1 Tax=Fopius arisanus TaxID=64838 RepID=A0A9R1T5H3_9HYME|nr:PREDICTED: sperm-associated antigen 1 [Fopius arisanus]XP_011303068.1 PREDICTED: sperm-associated antigen 1 [Fopius arisanus]